MTERKVYILLTDTSSFLTKLIKLYTKKPYNHASISFDSDLSEVYSFGRKQAGNPFNGGFVKEDVEEGLFKKAECAVYSLTVPEDQFKKMKRYIHELEAKKESYRYNFLGLFGFIFHKPIKRDKALFCSEFVATVLKESNTVDFDRPTALIAPNNLQEIPDMKLVYEGNLRDYLHKGVNEEWYVPVHSFSVGL